MGSVLGVRRAGTQQDDDDDDEEGVHHAGQYLRLLDDPDACNALAADARFLVRFTAASNADQAMRAEARSMLRS